MTSSSVLAAKEDQCNEVFLAALDSTKLPTLQQKIDYMQKFGTQCEGTGLFESRLGSFFLEAQRLDEAERILRLGLAHPNKYHKELQFGLAHLHIARGRFTEASSKGTMLTREYSQWHGGFRVLAQINLMQKRFDESIRYGVEANKREPEAGVYLGLAIAHYQLDRYTEAVDSAYSAIKLDRSVVRKSAGINEAIYALVQLKRDSEARELAKARMDADPKWRDDAAFAKAARHLRLL